ncbi:NHLP leader peptide family RiPP precursor [Nostoc sp. UHCC 0251]|uniref:NHLP leader peptide family RiPP precursor n=1 Tax=Nostoc sp. UHCC 0251 TaxID=3110240 RepID=UPI002B1FC6B5|nr:NHLP leader peptide family RiPP precursor [Nostoc sp. UHCC 0251]MEA5627197.1 NHLP leader peptide family RiPP precursor [Nostoc sp. UHCC 0251]
MTTITNIQTAQEVIARVWSDESLKTKLLNNPKSVLAEYGLEFPNSVEVQVHEDTSSLMNYVLPQASEIPQGVDLEEVEPVAGKVMKLALADETFKTKLLSDPKPAIAQAMGLMLPMSLEIRVYEDTPTVKHLVLPVNPFNSELSDADLELVAGGKASDKDQAIICGSTSGGAAIGCAAAAFTTPIAAVASGVAGGSAAIASSVAANT